ncbi:MAG: CHASE3 domain-containing protein [Bacteroidota bacterium]
MQLNIRSILTSTIFLKSIFVASLFILIFISSVTYKNTLALTHSSEALVKSHKTNRVLEQIMSYLKDAETGQRGFLITKDSIFLEPYIGSRQNIDLNLKTLKYLTTNTIQQQRNLKSLQMLINIRYDLFDKLLINYDGKAVNPNQFSKFMLNDKSVMDTIRDKINKMIELENIYLNRQKNELDTNISITPILTLMLFMFPLGVFVISYILINKNLLNLKEANKELIINSESMKHAQQIGEFSTSQWDIETHQINYSDNFFSLLGYKPQSFKPTMKTFLKFVHPADRDSVLKSVRQVLENKEPTILYFRIMHADGSIRYFKSIGKMLVDSQNKQTLIGVMSDITTENQKSLDLESKNKELAQSNIELANFNQIASHDLQEPLRKIQIFISRIEEKEKNNLSDVGKDYFDKIHNAAQRMRALIDDLLLFSSTNKEEKVFETTDLDELLDAVQLELSETILEKKAVIEAEHLPTLQVIAFQIQQLFLNLISNALKYSKITENPLIKIACQKVVAKNESLLKINNDQIFYKITFTDNGLGFDQQHAEKIFALFHRLHQKSEYSGTGIGLAICKKIVENHNGYIFAEGKLTVGATFTIYLPE